MTIAAWELVLEAARSLTTRGLTEFTRAQLLDEVRRRDASRRPESLGPVIQGMTANATGGPPSPCGTPLIRVGHGVYRLTGHVPATPPATESPTLPAVPGPVPRAIVRAIAASFTVAGVEPPPAPAIRATIGLPLERAFGQLLGANIDDPRVARSIGHYQHYFKEFVLPDARSLIFAGVAEGLATLGDEGFSLAVATSKYYRSADALLVAAGLREHFDVVVGADQVTLPKPNPEMAEAIMRQLAASAAGALMVGDTTHDLVMANAAGMRSIAVTYGVHGRSELDRADPTWTADSFEDVVKRVQNAFGSMREKGDAL